MAPKKNIELLEKFDDETLNHLRDVEFMILKDFIKICEEHDLEYYSYGGTALGAIRHGGFIPWDDDVDVLLFREDYDKFIQITKNKYTEKYDFLDMENFEDYLQMCCKMSLKGTDRHDRWSKNSSFNVGIHIDIFALDYAPSNKIKWHIFHKKCQLLIKIGFLLDALRVESYSTNTRRLIGSILKFTFKIFDITPKTYKEHYKKFVKKTNPKDKLVYDMNARCYNKPYPEEIFRPSKKVTFESIEINVPKDVDTYLKITFGDYMKIPPEEERHYHFSDNIDFGKY